MRLFLCFSMRRTASGGRSRAVTGNLPTMRFRGNYERAEGYDRQLMDYAGEHRCLQAGFSKEITMINYEITIDVS